MNTHTWRCAFVISISSGVVMSPAHAQCSSTWLPMAAGVNGGVWDVARLPNGDLVVGGEFTAAGAVAAYGVARWDGVSWSALGSGTDGPVYALATLPNGDLVAAGEFTTAGGGQATNIARWDGASWSALGSGLSWTPQSTEVRALAVLPDGTLVAGGQFSYAGGMPASNIARWDGASWSALGGGLPGMVSVLKTLPDGDLLAGGWTDLTGILGIVRWNGTSWSPVLFGVGLFGSPAALEVLPSGDLVIGGFFSTASGAHHSLVRWDGTSWTPWSPAIPGYLLALATLPNGDLVAGGAFSTAGSANASNIARWDGTAWSALAAGTNSEVRALAWEPSGNLVVGGAFTAAGGASASRIARFTSTCPATAAVYGSGCIGPAGRTALVATELPWLAATFRATATGMTPTALAVGAFGFQQLAIPMPIVHPLGVAGCELLVSDDILLPFANANGRVQTSLAIPNAAALVGAAFYHQVVPLEFDASGNLVALTSTNALALSIGTF